MSQCASHRVKWCMCVQAKLDWLITLPAHNAWYDVAQAPTLASCSI